MFDAPSIPVLEAAFDAVRGGGTRRAVVDIAHATFASDIGYQKIGRYRAEFEEFTVRVQREIAEDAIQLLNCRTVFQEYEPPLIPYDVGDIAQRWPQESMGSRFPLLGLVAQARCADRFA
jgi:hypothetical protein